MSKQHRFSSYIASHRQLWIIGAVFALIYMGNGSFLPYLSLYYKEAGLSTTQITLRSRFWERQILQISPAV